ncbi:uncharacterized protein LOC126369421 isoform X1 [Pectinophora gossypiella]|uniref:uncharacterized protein LOC126369421 isoform X1 n=1 Tax=Pectinophora gossypiella TaxID=13191 RepID=UPI00214E3698|nr:uncharacterized protein LOC126369421 isoform X1 [Pectinophora gossypiella]
MGWILQCLFWVTLTTTSAYNYRQFSPDYVDYSGYTSGHNRAQARRIDYHTIQSYVNEDNGNPERYTNSFKTQRPTHERSIAVDSGIQRIQEKEKRRVQSWVDNSGPRSENGSYKIVNRPVKYATIHTRRGSNDQRPLDSVVFPGRTSAEKFQPEIPSDCMAMGVCETIPNYPQDVVNNIINKLGDKINNFQLDKLEPEIAQRQGPEHSVVDLCISREKVLSPEAAKGKDGKWYVIFNRKDKPIQGYRVEICQSSKQSCNSIAVFNNGYTSACKQKFMERRMTAVDVDRQELMYDMPFHLPSCCSCVGIHSSGV